MKQLAIPHSSLILVSCSKVITEKSTLKEGERTEKVTFHFNEKNHIYKTLETTDLESPDNSTLLSSYKYNKQDFMILESQHLLPEKTISREAGTYDYVEFDENGNWTKVIVSNAFDGEKIFEHRRTIEYYNKAE